jgi:hypothetical protein
LPNAIHRLTFRGGRLLLDIGREDDAVGWKTPTLNALKGAVEADRYFPTGEGKTPKMITIFNLPKSSTFGSWRAA